MDPAPSLGCSLKDVKWSSVAVPLDLLVSTYRLPQIARLDSGESWPGRRRGADGRGPQPRRGCREGGTRRGGAAAPRRGAGRAAAAALARRSPLPPQPLRDVEIGSPCSIIKKDAWKKKKKKKTNLGKTSADANLGGELSLPPACKNYSTWETLKSYLRQLS